MSPLSRRNLLAGAAALSVPALPAALPALAASAAQHPDAELVALGKEFDRRHVVLARTKIECVPVYEAFKAAINKRRYEPVARRDLDEIMQETGYNTAAQRENAAFEYVDEIAARIRETPARTMVGIAVKVKAAAFDCHFSLDFDGPEEDMDWDVQCFFNLIKEVERLAGGAA